MVLMIFESIHLILFSESWLLFVIILLLFNVTCYYFYNKIKITYLVYSIFLVYIKGMNAMPTYTLDIQITVLYVITMLNLLDETKKKAL